MSAFVLDRLPARWALAAIRFYQRFISPYKGFACAYRVHTGRASCSALGHRAVRWRGLFTGLGLIGERLKRCGEVYRRVHGEGGRRLTRLVRNDQRGDCDCLVPDVSGCELPSDCDPCDRCDRRAIGDALRCCDCLDCGDWERKKRQQRTHDQPAARRAGR